MPVVAILTSYGAESFPQAIASAVNFDELDVDRLLNLV